MKHDPDHHVEHTRNRALAPNDQGPLRRLIHSPWPESGPSTVLPDPNANVLLTNAASAVSLPKRDQLLVLDHGIAAHLPSKGSAISSIPAPLVPAPLSLYVDALGTRSSLPIQPLSALHVANPGGAPAAVFDCAAHIYDMLWLPTPDDSEWLLVACAADRDTRTVIGEPAGSGSLQLWEVPPGSPPRLILTLVHDAGTPLKLTRISPSELGIAAVLFSDGTVRLIDIPRTSGHVRISDILTLRVPHTSCTALAWSGSFLAAGCLNGDIALWDIGEALQRSSSQPAACAPVHDTAVSALAWNLSTGTGDSVLLSVGFDGSEFLSDPHSFFSPFRLAHGREPRYCVAWSPWLDGWIVDLGVTQFGTTSLLADVGQHHTVGFHHGRILSLSASPYHPFAASGSADGSVKVTNALSATKRKAVDPRFRVMHKLFRFSRQDDSLVMMQGFFPEGTAPSSANKVAPPMLDDWDPSIAVQAVAWNPNVARGLLLASGLSCGIARIDWVEG